MLSEQYGFKPYHESRKREGWLLNYNTVTSRDGVMMTELYLVDEGCSSFLVTIPYFPSFLLKVCECDAVEEYMKKKYVGEIEGIERVSRIDFREYNHLNKPAGTFLQVKFKTELGFNAAARSIKQILARNKARKNDDADYNEFLGENRALDAEECLLLIGEYDIPVEVSVANNLGIRAGKWYSFHYTGERYVIERSDRIISPDLRILAFDIETSKKPLKFPNPENDEIMMISIKTESGGELIVNRKLVSRDIEEFEYSPRCDMQCFFKISNEDDEEALLIRFIEIVQKHRPHLVTTFNGAFFDFPFVEKRLARYGVSLEETTGFYCRDEYYVSPFTVHLDCYKWVKRDSYLPVGSQGLKSVTRIKLGYFPDEVDPEDMMDLATTEPGRMASYSASDAVATYFLYTKYVQPHVFSVCSLVPLPPTSVLCQGSGTLCEALLISEAGSYNVFVPERRREVCLKEYNGHVVESMTYVGGHVECLKAGIFRSDFEYDFKIDETFVGMVVDSLDDMLSEYRDEDDFEQTKTSIARNLRDNVGSTRKEGSIYHLDVGAMYPNIILTNKLQPVSVVDDDICIRCDFSDSSNRCKRKMDWVLKVEYIPPSKNEVEMLRNQLARELPGGRYSSEQDEVLKLRVREYSKRIYRKLKVKETSLRSSTVCQREIPFYVETVRKFRDQRYVYKKLQADATEALEKATSDEEKINLRKSIVIYSSLQVAHKCILNSFYGYVMRKSSRWYSMEMAAIVCNVGGDIIRKAKEVVESIGISLELDTDGIWCIIPTPLISSYTFSSGKKLSLLAKLLNYFVCKDFSNDQYQEKNGDEYATRTENSIFFEIDGPYRAMLLPASTEESRLLKKRYAIINDDNTIAELKGFEIKRRGELEIIKKLQEELFLHFLDGNTLEECYKALSDVCDYWMDIVRSKGEYLDDETVIELLSESRSMSKEFGEYDGKKSNLTNTASRMSEFLGKSILEEKLKCEYVVAAYPENRSVADRTIPVMIFRSMDRDRFLEKWLGRKYPGDVRKIIDWEYYRSRLECVIQRMIILPALSQGIKNPMEGVRVPSWALKQKSGLGELRFKKIEDIEEVGNRVCTTGTRTCVGNTSGQERCVEDQELVMDDIEERVRLLKTDFVRYLNNRRDEWIRRVKHPSPCGDVVKLAYGEELNIYRMNDAEPVEKAELERVIYMQVNNWMHFEESSRTRKVRMHLPDGVEAVEMASISLKEAEFVKNRSLYRKFFDHFSIKRVFEDRVPISWSNIKESDGSPINYTIVTSFIFQGNVVYAIGRDVVFIHEDQNNLYELVMHASAGGRSKIVVFNTEDPSRSRLKRMFKRFHVLEVSFKVHASPNGYKELCHERRRMHERMDAEVRLMCETSLYTRMPILNINEELLDVLLYKEMRLKGVVCDAGKCEKHYGIGLKTEKFKPGFYGRYCVEFECVGTLILSVIEHKAFLGEDTQFGGVMRRDFAVLECFLRKIVLDSARGIDGTRLLLRHAASWINTDSKIISEELRGICRLLQQKYIIHLVGRLREHDYDVISVGMDMIMVNTGKSNEESADLFFQHLSGKISTFLGYEMMRTRMVRKFQKLAFVDPNSYFFVENGKYLCFSRFRVPVLFLENYFENDKIDHDLVYGMVLQIPVDSARVILDMMSLRLDTQSLRSNCYKLLRLNEFEDKRVNDIVLDIVCPRCKTQNVLRIKCIKCYMEYPREAVLDVAISHLRYLIWLELVGDSYCNRCNGVNGRRLCDYCKCGGMFQKKRYWGEVNKLKEIVSNETFDDLCSMASCHFAK